MWFMELTGTKAGGIIALVITPATSKVDPFTPGAWSTAF